MKATLSQKEIDSDPTALEPFAAPFLLQLWTVVVRVFEQYWRTPSYLYSKTALCTATVSCMPNTLMMLFLILLGSLYRFLLLAFPNIPPGNAEPTFLHLHASNSLRQLGSTNHASLRHPTSTLRGARATFQDLLLASLHSV
jgi:hypothetical protein